MLEQIFLKVLDMSRTASVIIVIVSIVRILLKRFPKSISYMLWSVVLFRLLSPFTFEFRISLIPDMKPVLYEYTLEKYASEKYTSEKESAPTGWTGGSVVADAGVGAEEWQGKPGLGQAAPTELQPDGGLRATEASWQELFLLYGKYVWISGTGTLFLYCMVSAARIRGRVSASIPLKENIYIMDEMMSPFVMGILSPRIYLPGCLSGKEQEYKYIIQHERFHIRRLDYIVKPLAFAALCIHWFNPLVWAAFVLACKDMEMSCDEAVIKKLGEDIRADYSASLLALSTQRRIIRWSPVDFGEGDAKGRIRNLASIRKTKKGVLAVLATGAAILIICLASDRGALASSTSNLGAATDVAEDQEMPDEAGPDGLEPNGLGLEESDGQDNPDPLIVSLDIREHYVTHRGNPINLFYIDEDGVLWGSGRNECGQLGQGTQDYEFHSERAKIAEDVIHVDYSQNGFVIFLTKDYKLYGVGNAGCGALQQYEEFDWVRYANGEHYTVTRPILLMEDVVYACCGRNDVVCMKEDGTVWTWGTVYFEGGYYASNVCFYQKPIKILEDAVLVTGGWFNHAALLRDGTVWTWGYNSSGNCGVADPTLIGEPTMVAEGVVMVWTDFALVGYPEPDVEEVAMTWTGSLRYDMEYEDIAEFGEFCPKHLNNTVIQKADGSYWVCGEYVGTEEKMVHGQEGYYPAVCTHEFHLCK